MKTLFISLLFLTFAQAASAVTIDLDEANSKKLYTVLASWGTRMNDAAHKRTYESVTNVKCGKDAMDNYACRLHDELHNTDPALSGPIAKSLFDIVGTYNTIVCSIRPQTCGVGTEAIKCIHYWNPKYNDLRRSYVCMIEANVN